MDENRNILPKFAHWPTEEIKAHLKKESFPFAVLMEHFTGDFNISSVLLEL
jgi:hypothetical protein